VDRGCDPTGRRAQPASVAFQEKWRHAITLFRRARAAGLQLTAVVADAEFGDITAFRRLLHQWRLPYALGISHHLTVFRGTPAVHSPPDPRTGRPRSQLVMVDRKTVTIPSARWRSACPRGQGEA
jgi:SRSO17 transposase